MTLGRQDIEKRDFPTGRRGYDPEAVDRHLREVASEVEALRAEASSSDGAAPLAAAASEQVRTIVAAGEKSAEEIRRQAADEADRTRTQAATQAREHVERVSAATAAVLRRLEAIESELGALFEGMRGDAGRIRAELAQLQEGMGELRVATGGGEQGAGREEPQTDQAARAKAAEPVGDEQPAVEEKETPRVEEKEPTVEEAPTAAPAPDADSEGARLIALNMALNGTPREQTDRYLAENFDVPNRGTLLDEVYARVG